MYPGARVDDAGVEENCFMSNPYLNLVKLHDTIQIRINNSSLFRINNSLPCQDLNHGPPQRQAMKLTIELWWLDHVNFWNCSKQNCFIDRQNAEMWLVKISFLSSLKLTWRCQIFLLKGLTSNIAETNNNEQCLPTVHLALGKISYTWTYFLGQAIGQYHTKMIDNSCLR